MKLRDVSLTVLAALIAPGMALAAQPPAETKVDELTVSPIPAPLGTGVSRDRLGLTVQTVTDAAFNQAGSLSITEGLQRGVAGISISDTQGNLFANDLEYRGFGASPLQGRAQGLAIYVNGQRMNEAFGDTMNWDLIPETAIRRADVFTTNPVFGLNALGGSINLTLKDGRTFQGFEGRVEGGPHNSRAAAVEFGSRFAGFRVYGAVDGGTDDGWRQQSASDVTRAYVDIGTDAWGGELHLVGGVGHSTLGVVGPTPVDLLDADRTSVFTFPQTTVNDGKFLALNGAWQLGSGWRVQGGVHARWFRQDHLDGNDGDFERCASAGPLANTLCLEEDAFDNLPPLLQPTTAQLQLLTASNTPIACPTLISTANDTNGCRNRESSFAPNNTPRIPYGTLDRTATRTRSWGGELVFNNDGMLFGRRNTAILGAAYDRNSINFQSDSTLALITPDLEVSTAGYAVINVNGAVPGLGQVIHTASNVGYGPADLNVSSWNSGLFGSNTIDLTETLSLTVGARYNTAVINMEDQTGLHPELTANHRFERLNPAVNVAWRPAPGIALFAGYAESNRAPTPLELSCSDPQQPCLLENSLVADPPLFQVVSKTWEVGGRGAYDVRGGRLTWNGAFFSTDNENDIISVASDIIGRGYYLNVPGTRRAGFEGMVSLTRQNWSIYAGYSQIEATYQFNGALPSPNNPAADADGNIAVVSGDRIGGIPTERIKLGVEARIGSRVSIGLDGQYAGPAFFSGDEGNDNAKLPGYWTANLRADFSVTDKVVLFARVTNLFDEEFATFGTYFEAEAVQRVRPQPLPASPDERSLTPAAPRTVFIGLKARF